MNSMRKIGMLALSVALACSLCVLAGCSNSEQVVRDGTAELLDHYKNADEAVLEANRSALSDIEAEALGINVDDLTKAGLEGFDYTIDDVTVDGDNAEAVVTITCKDLSNLKDRSVELMSELQSDPSIAREKGTDGVLLWVGEQLQSYVSDAPVVTHEPLTLEYHRADNVWEMTTASHEALGALLGSSPS